VLPAFETAPLSDTEEAHALARTAAAQNKEGLQKMVEKEQLWQFALKLFKAVRTGPTRVTSITSMQLYRHVAGAPAAVKCVEGVSICGHICSCSRDMGSGSVTLTDTMRGDPILLPTGSQLHRLPPLVVCPGAVWSHWLD
jgi:hypothetical protein